MAELNPAGLALSELFIEVFRINGALLTAGDEITKPMGLTSSRWQVLGVIGHRPGTVAEIARAMGLARQSVQQTADALVADGLACFEANPRHRRSKLLAATPAGQSALSRVESRHAQWANRLATQLNPEQITTVAVTLRELAALVDNEPTDPEVPDGQ